MENREIGIEEARKILGDLASEAGYLGRSIILTRKGKPIARIAPLKETSEDPRFANMPDAIIADLLHDTAASVAAAYTRLGRAAQTAEAKATAKEKAKEAWLIKRRTLSRGEMISEIQHLNSVLDKLKTEYDV
ncbi:hypothetical protein SAMN02745673_00923 [Marinactinospora thermotolerans DSM 45154]|uniref:Antitoxin n=1 Tax=Marinactinospora thermotolerans DSM 45154 TaxID=1122192 RepID=A0A1T4M3S1_9ACTN|nr:hypothetical protein [Marinactinospora thermotolerans]SJZ61364.1 hypothetical protein SAMN02745673_00923 [Marinactinospora thermotolerans DSM 45154]